jgi:conjugative transfer pilus assembly protein TraH
MQYAPNGLGAGIRTLARYDEGMARLFVEQAAPVIAMAYPGSSSRPSPPRR